ncbi:Acyl carrier protein 1, mitochondrial-like protein [Drosera capensis]
MSTILLSGEWVSCLLLCQLVSAFPFKTRIAGGLSLFIERERERERGCISDSCFSLTRVDSGYDALLFGDDTINEIPSRTSIVELYYCYRKYNVISWLIQCRFCTHDFGLSRFLVVTTDVHFQKDLGLDSLDNVELVMALEEEFKLEIPDLEADKIDSTKLAIEYIYNHPMSS